MNDPDIKWFDSSKNDIDQIVNEILEEKLNIKFEKLHGAGNDYIAIDGRGIDIDWGKLSFQMSQPHFGVFSDGIVVLKDSEKANAKIKIFNPDGSEAEMSGNGVRLFSKFVLDNNLTDFDGEVLLLKLAAESGRYFQFLIMAK